MFFGEGLCVRAKTGVSVGQCVPPATCHAEMWYSFLIRLSQWQAPSTTCIGVDSLKRAISEIQGVYQEKVQLINPNNIPGHQSKGQRWAKTLSLWAGKRNSVLDKSPLDS